MPLHPGAFNSQNKITLAHLARPCLKEFTGQPKYEYDVTKLCMLHTVDPS